jgi:16S rRNA (guanine527-N7)-methyltransferase
MMALAPQSVGGLDVSRETIDLLVAYEAEVRRWNSTVNLVSRNSLESLWVRHIEDSAQIFAHCPEDAARWVDLGSGAGFPGLVVAVLAREKRKALQVVLVEADKRKAVFLRQTIQKLGLETTLFPDRIESVPALGADVISARALAPLAQLLEFALPHLKPAGTALFLKGARYGEEVAEARKSWDFDLDVSPSLSQQDAAILTIRKLNRAKPS